MSRVEWNPHVDMVERGLTEPFIPDKVRAFDRKPLGTGQCFGQVALTSIHRHTIFALALKDIW